MQNLHVQKYKIKTQNLLLLEKKFLRQKIFNYRNRHATAVQSNEQIHPTELRVEPLLYIQNNIINIKKNVKYKQHGIHYTI